MQALATIDGYEARYGEVDAPMRERVEARLLDASALVLSEMGGYVPGEDEVLDANVEAVVCEVVRRAVSAAVEGASQYQQTAGAYSASVSFANPDGALYLSGSNRARLGISSGAVVAGRMVGPCSCSRRRK